MKHFLEFSGALLVPFVTPLLIPVWGAVTIGAPVFFYIRHRNRIELERCVSAGVYVLAVITCGAVAGVLGIGFGVRWACAGPNAGNLCGLAGFLVVGPLATTLATVLVGLALSLIRPGSGADGGTRTPPANLR